MPPSRLLSPNSPVSVPLPVMEHLTYRPGLSQACRQESREARRASSCSGLCGPLLACWPAAGGVGSMVGLENISTDGAAVGKRSLSINHIPPGPGSLLDAPGSRDHDSRCPCPELLVPVPGWPAWPGAAVSLHALCGLRKIPPCRWQEAIASLVLTFPSCVHWPRAPADVGGSPLSGAPATPGSQLPGCLLRSAHISAASTVSSWFTWEILRSACFYLFYDP